MGGKSFSASTKGACAPIGARFLRRRSSLSLHLKGLQLNQFKRDRTQIAFFGHFDSTNFGNESTLQAILYHLRCFRPDAEITCISDGREAISRTRQIYAIKRFVKS